jgi:hypothetical protein
MSHLARLVVLNWSHNHLKGGPLVVIPTRLLFCYCKYILCIVLQIRKDYSIIIGPIEHKVFETIAYYDQRKCKRNQWEEIILPFTLMPFLHINCSSYCLCQKGVMWGESVPLREISVKKKNNPLIFFQSTLISLANVPRQPCVHLASMLNFSYVITANIHWDKHRFDTD